MTARLLEVLRDQNCGAVIAVPRSQYPEAGGPMIDLRLQSGGASPFGSLEDLEMLSGQPFVVRPDLASENDTRSPHFSDLDVILSVRKKGHRVLCVPDDAKLSPRISLTPEEKLASRLWLASAYFPELFLKLAAESGALARLDAARDPALYSLIKRFIDGQDADSLKETLPALLALISKSSGEAGANRIFARFELFAGYRERPSIGIYDHALQLAGGGQKYACVMAAALQKDFDVTFIANKPVTLQKLEEWYGLDLSGCRIRILPLPFYEEKKSEFIDHGMAKYAPHNPFEPVSEESKRYDIFVNVNMLTLVKPQSPVSVFLCHFPDSKKGRYFSVQEYTYIIANSLYTIEWLKKRWNMTPSVHIYPPINMPAPEEPKQRLILSVARFEEGGTKKQLELIDAYARLRASSASAADWKLILAGGSFGRSLYLKKVQKKARSVPGVEVYANLPVGELKKLYARASIFWHACGLGTNVPERIEHFGMTTVEAMQNGCVPVVINKGGQKEIVEPGISGFLFDDLGGLCETTLKLTGDLGQLTRFSKAARERSRRFAGVRFDDEVVEFFRRVSLADLKVTLSR